jgi:glycosyltransferase involved in cell wall biosynthesis
MKIFYFNFNVGSGAEYVGDIFASWLSEIEGVMLLEYKIQSSSAEILEMLMKYRPDMIILNDTFERTRVPIDEYLKKYPLAKLVLLAHCWSELVPDPKIPADLIRLISICSKIFCLNVAPKRVLKDLPHTVVNAYHPMNSRVYKIITPWNDRPNKFLIFGNILNVKLSKAFISDIAKTNLRIDCYGRRITSNDMVEYNKAFDNCSNLSYKGCVSQEEVPLLLNEYKYLILPHDGQEPFNLSLLQAILCGTIPLVSNDKNTRQYDARWIDWAHGLYNSCNMASELVNNLVSIDKDNPDLDIESKQISLEASKRFDYDHLKASFSEYIDECNKDKEKKPTEKSCAPNIWYGNKKETPIPSTFKSTRPKFIATDAWYGKMEKKDAWYDKKEQKCILGREQFIRCRVGPCGNMRNDSIYPIGVDVNFDDFKKRAITISKNFGDNCSYDGESDTYSVEQYQGAIGENLELRGQGESYFRVIFEEDKWRFYKQGVLQFEASSAKELEEKLGG